MKILFVVEHFYPYVGGAEELFLNLTVSLVKAGHDVEVITTLYDKSLPKIEAFSGVNITRINCHNRFLFTIFSLPTIIRKAKNADCIHTTSYNSALPSFLAGLIRNKKVLITFHEVWGKLWFQLPFTGKFKLTCYYLYEWFILKLPFYKYIAVSDFTRKSLIKNGISERKIIKIYNGIEYDNLLNYQYSPPEKFTFCFFGRLGISKGIDLLLEATKTFVLNHPEATLKLIIPDYPAALFQKVNTLINDYGIRKNIILLHNLSKEELLHQVSNSSCVIIPSYSEGFCFVAVESQGMNVPIISSGMGSLSEVVGGKHIQMKVLTSDSINEALEKAINNNWNVSPAKVFTLKDSMETYLDVYKNLKQT